MKGSLKRGVCPVSRISFFCMMRKKMEEGTILISVGESEKRRRKRRRRKKGSKEDHRVLTQRKKGKSLEEEICRVMSSVQCKLLHSLSLVSLSVCEREIV